jgi:hypothetical protein
MQSTDGELAIKVMMRVEHDPRIKLGRQRAKPPDELAARPRRFAQMIARQTRSEELHEHDVFAGVFGFGGNDD